MYLREDPLKNFPSIRRRKRVSTSNYYMYTTEKCTFWQVMVLEANRHKIIRLYINTYVKDHRYLAGGRVLRRGRPPSASASAGVGAAAGASGMNVGISQRPTLLSTAPRLVGLFAAQPRTEAGEPGPLRRQEARPRNGEPGLGSPPKGGNTPRRAGVLSRPDAEEEPAIGAGRVACARPSTGLAAAHAGVILGARTAGTSWDI
jgi:hypothetical protein